MAAVSKSTQLRLRRSASSVAVRALSRGTEFGVWAGMLRACRRRFRRIGVSLP